jgi:pimeloyl-ACP methyl ester carboxylesterase
VTRAHPAPRTIGRTLLVVVLAGLLALAGLAASAAAKRTLAATDRPTIVLVHGAWADETAWTEVVAKLHKDGFETSTPRLGLLSAGADVSTVRATLDGIAGRKILVGHSYAGWVISNAASGRSDVLGLVFTAAYVPAEGDTVLSLGDGYAPPAALPDLLWTGAPFASLAYIDPARFRDDFAQDLSPKAAAEMSDHQQAIAFPIFVTPSGPVAWHTLPSWFAISGADRMVDPALQRAEANKIGATTVVFDDASHAGGFTHYATRFTKLIEQAAAATAG